MTYASPYARATLIRGARVIDPAAGIDDVVDLLVSPDGVRLDPSGIAPGAAIFDARGLWAMPGLIDLQVHFREPGQTHKEDLTSGARAAVAGGVTTVVVMPNTRPVLDDPKLVRMQHDVAEKNGLARVLVAASATVGSKGERISDYAALKNAGAVAVTDDGLPVLDDAVMRDALVSCRKNDLLFMQHAEDTRITHHVPMTESDVSHAAGVDGQPPEAESNIVARDTAYATEIGARYHVLHLSTKESLAHVRRAKAKEARVSCEVSPHHLMLTVDDVVRKGVARPSSADDLDVNRKMNPPLRTKADREALIEGLADGTVDAVATDHAPHAASEKGKGFVDAPFGVTGLETLLAVVLEFAHRGVIPATRAVELLTAGPARVLQRNAGALSALPDVTLVDPALAWTVNAGTVESRSKNSSFLGRTFRGRCVATFVRGRCVYRLVT